ncbi:flagellar assembly protein FliH [Entomohabitans teleogrylli]|uniref:flagellar assembly protein FliH n=1 Tax=Entomohabitans teleogrylli TaxID=1384589 RepID=UPI0009E93D37|nr:flagellar assembly protein FliH [Entomohabitans teleogrylli]
MSDKNWQHWQPTDLLAESRHREPEITAPAKNYPSEELLQAELSRLRQQAEKAGFAQGEARGLEEGSQRGYEEGLSQGRQQGLEQGLAESQAQLAHNAGQLNQLLEAFKSALDSLDCVIPSRLVQLSLSAVRALVGKSVVIDNALLLEKIQQLVEEDPLLKGEAQLWVNHEEVALVEQHLGATLKSLGWQLRGDAHMLPGGCRITSPLGEIDATLETRWRELCDLSREESCR